MEQELIMLRGLGVGKGVTQFKIRPLEKNVGFGGPKSRPNSQEGRPLLGGGVGRGLFGSGAYGERLPDVFGKRTTYDPHSQDAMRAESRAKAFAKSGSAFTSDPGYPWYEPNKIAPGSSGEAFGYDKRKEQARTTTEFTDEDLRLLAEPADRRAGSMYRMHFNSDVSEIARQMPRAKPKGIIRDGVTEMRDLCIKGHQAVDGVLSMKSSIKPFPVVWQK